MHELPIETVHSRPLPVRLRKTAGMPQFRRPGFRTTQFADFKPP